MLEWQKCLWITDFYCWELEPDPEVGYRVACVIAALGQFQGLRALATERDSGQDIPMETGYYRNDKLKNIAQVEHSRYRNFDNFIVNTLGAIAAYYMSHKKPCIYVQRTQDTQPAILNSSNSRYLYRYCLLTAIVVLWKYAF